MSPNGRRAWRIAAKKLRRKLGHRWRSQSNWTEQKWRDLVPDLEAHRAHVSGAWFKRHGFTMDDSRYEIRQYIGTWGTVDGDGVEFAIKPASFTPRSLVGMTQGTRKRRAREWMECERLHQRAQDLQEVVDRQMGRRSQPRTVGHTPGRLKQHYRIGQKLRPCPGCCACWGHRISSAYGEIAECCGPQTSGKRKSQIKAMRKWQETLADNCDGSGVLPSAEVPTTKLEHDPQPTSFPCAFVGDVDLLLISLTFV